MDRELGVRQDQRAGFWELKGIVGEQVWDAALVPDATMPKLGKPPKSPKKERKEGSREER